jgi:hypothetical protein
MIVEKPVEYPVEWSADFINWFYDYSFFLFPFFSQRQKPPVRLFSRKQRLITHVGNSSFFVVIHETRGVP